MSPTAMEVDLPVPTDTVQNEEVETSYYKSYEEMVTEMQRVRLLPQHYSFKVMPPTDLCELITAHDIEGALVQKKVHFFSKFPFYTVNGHAVYLSPDSFSGIRGKQKAEVLFKYVQNLYLLSTLLSNKSHFDILQKNLNNFFTASTATTAAPVSQNFLMDIVADIEKELTPVMQTIPTSGLDLNSLDLTNPMALVQNLSGSGIDIFGIVNKVSGKINQKMSEGALNENDLQSMLSSMIQSIGGSASLSHSVEP